LIISGIQPTGNITLGNYLGAIRHWKKMQNEPCLFFVADLHSLTNYKDNLKSKIYDTVAILLSSGIDEENIFVQSSVKEHAHLAWILTCMTHLGELKRMVQFKDKSSSINNAGLLTYPCLQAADILLYQATTVPIGIDQRQHLELTKNIAQKFNYKFGHTFQEPKALIYPQTSKIMDLQNPLIKMSKSNQNQAGVINLLDTKDTIIKKFSKCQTDSLNNIDYNDNQPGIKNLINIGEAFGPLQIDNLSNQYGKLKKLIADKVLSDIHPIQNEFSKIRRDEDYIKNIIQKGNIKAVNIASKTIKEVSDKIGIC